MRYYLLKIDNKGYYYSDNFYEKDVLVNRDNAVAFNIDEINSIIQDIMLNKDPSQISFELERIE